VGNVDVVCWKKRSNFLIDLLHPQEQQSFEKQGGTISGLIGTFKIWYVPPVSPWFGPR
jgi:hypothetical protein